MTFSKLLSEKTLCNLLLMSFRYLSLCLPTPTASEVTRITSEIKLLHLLAEGSEPAHGQSDILPGDNNGADPNHTQKLPSGQGGSHHDPEHLSLQISPLKQR